MITDQMPVWRFPSVFESSHMLPIFCLFVCLFVVCFDLCCFVLVMVIIY